MTKRVLGRGLDALIPGSAPEPNHETALSEIPLDKITPNPEQPRREMSPEALDELARSISRYGVIEPIVVRRTGDGFQLVAGERRVMAARRAGLETIPAVERDGSSEDMLAVALIENIQRENLNPIEEALAYRRLADEFTLTQDEIAERVGRSRVFVANTLRLLQLPEEIRRDVSRGTVTAGHARAILAVESEEAQRALWQRIVSDKLTVRAAESLARESKPADTTARPKTPRKSRTTTSPEVRDLEERLRERLGTQIRIVEQGRGGKIEVTYYDPGDLQRLLDILGLSDGR